MKLFSTGFKLTVFALAIMLLITLAVSPMLIFAAPTEPAKLSGTAFPDSYTQSGPSRLVMQIIDNRFHMWHEYENPAGNGLCIYLLEPNEKALSETEAAVLLQLSREWERQSLTYRPASGTIESEFEKLFFLEPVYGISRHNLDFNNTNTLENEEMIDNRTPVNESLVLTYPYNTVGFLAIDFSSNLMRGTAFLISPYTALTNAHNVYAPSFGGWFETIAFSPAQHEVEEGSVIKPFGTQSPIKAETNEYFLNYENDGNRDMSIKYDYAAIFFEAPFGGISTFMPLQFNYTPAEISLAGYPGSVRNTPTQGMWLSEGPVLNYDEYLLYYAAYTSGGVSGSPVFAYDPQADTYRVVSIHSFAVGNLFSGGPHLNSSNREIIEQWMRWTPYLLTNPVTSISLSETEISMEPGSKTVLIATVIPEDASNSDLIWSSSNAAVADIDANGIVSAIGTGSAVITVKTIDGSKKAACTVTVQGVPGEFKLGDINGDGNIDVLDVVLLMQGILLLTELDTRAEARADVNLDGEVDVADAALLMQYSLGMITSF